MIRLFKERITDNPDYASTTFSADDPWENTDGGYSNDSGNTLGIWDGLNSTEEYDTVVIEPDTTNSSQADLKMLDYSSSYTNNPCASNDAGNDYLAPCTYTEPKTQFLSCIAQNENDLMFDYGASATTVEFDYEIHTPVDPDVTLIVAVDEFQNGLAGSIAADFGVYCDHSGRILGKVTYSNETDDSIGGGGAYAPVPLGVSSSPSDTPDDFISKYTPGSSPPLEFTGSSHNSLFLYITAKCIIDVNLSEETTCTPMKGYLTLYARNRRHLTSTLDTIQNFIEKRTSEYLSENVLAVSFIGERESVGVGIINPSLLSRPNYGGRKLAATMEEGNAVGYAAAAVVGGMCALLLVFKRRRHTRAQGPLNGIRELQVV